MYVSEVVVHNYANDQSQTHAMLCTPKYSIVWEFYRKYSLVLIHKTAA